MASKLPKFLLCENPMLTGGYDGRLFILHSREPYLLAEVFHFENISDEKRMEVERQLATIAGRLDYGKETIFLSAVWLVPGKLAEKPAQDYANTLAGIMRRMADWYRAYLIWEDNQDHEE